MGGFSENRPLANAASTGKGTPMSEPVTLEVFSDYI